MNDDPLKAAALADLLRALEELRNRAAEMERNLAAQQALLDERLLRVEHNRVFALWNALARRLQNARGGLDRLLGRASAPPGDKALPGDYAKWIAHQEAALPPLEEAHAAAGAWPRRPRISLLLPVRRARGLAETLQSIENQVYRNWQLCVVVEKSCSPDVLPLLSGLETVVVEDFDFASALNAAAERAEGEYIAFLPEAVTLAPFALYFAARELQTGPVDLLYSDEDLLDRSGRRLRPIFKPGWSPDLLTSCMYLGPLLTVRREAFHQCGGLRRDYAGAELHDLALRLTDTPAQVRHIPKVLFHSPLDLRLDHTGSPCSATRAAARAIEDAVHRREGAAAECLPAPGGAGFLVRRQRPAGPAVVVICSRSPVLLRRCLSSLRATSARAVSQIIVVAHEESGPSAALRDVIREAGATAAPFGGPFHFAAMNNLGASLAQTPNLLFLNDDVEAGSSGWVELLNEQVSREEVGVAGAVLWYPSRVLQHAGVVTGLADGVGHAGRHAANSLLWPWLLAARNVSAVTGACLAIRTALFRRLGGFDIAFPNNYNDVDLCFRVREQGLSVVCVPAPGLIHRECQTRPGIVRFAERYQFYRRWAHVLAAPDPYYSPALAPTEEIALNLDGGPSPLGVVR
jgi:GT2 family glycosyltransferase